MASGGLRCVRAEAIVARSECNASTSDTVSPISGSHVSAEPFAQLATTTGISLHVEQVYHAPYDALESPEEMDRAYVVTLTTPEPEAGAVRLIFWTAPSATALERRDEDTTPTMRDILWWLAADAWAMEHARRDLATWAAQHGYDESTATMRRFDELLAQARALRKLFGEPNYTRLLDLYIAQVGAPTATAAAKRRADYPEDPPTAT